MLSEHHFETNDGYFGEDSHKHSDTFHKVSHGINSPVLRKGDYANVLSETKIYLSPNTQKIQRTSFNYIDLLASLGGFLNIFMILFGAIVYVLTEHLYLLSIMTQLYFAKTDNQDLFQMNEISKSGSCLSSPERVLQ